MSMASSTASIANILSNCSLDHSLTVKFGYEDLETMKADSQKRFSLLENGILDQPSTRLLLVNVSCTILSTYMVADSVIQGMNDSIFPIDDSILALQHGRVKEAR